jgi:hypothetical protein
VSLLDITPHLLTTNMLNTMKILHWAIAWWYPSIKFANLITECWLLQVKLWYSTRGFLWTIAHIKNIRLHITRFICGQPLFEAQGSVGLTKKGLPSGIPYLTDLLGTNQGKSFVLTLLNISRCLPGTKSPDLSTITDEWDGFITYQMREFIPEFVKLYNFKPFQSTFTLSDLYNSNKSGPIGHATQTSVLQADYAMRHLGEDLTTLTGGKPNDLVINGRIIHQIPNIMKPLIKWAPLALRYRNTLSQIFKSGNSHLAASLRKLSIVNDPEGKARIICIFDYWSQVSLKGIHDWALSQLRVIPQDRTFDQDPFMINKEGPYYSIDLTAATDRFPIELQVALLEKLSSTSVAQAWKNVLTAHEVYVPWEKSSVFYKTGQPMGAYSSWAIFALTHHFVVQYSAKQEGLILPFSDYMLLGDDIVIANKAVAERYISNMTDLGVGISLHKTHVSNDTYEFAKRWIHKGVEVSALPLKGLISTKGKYYQLIPLIYHIISGMPAKVYSSVPGLVYDFYVRTGLNIRHARSMYNRTAEFSAVWKYIRYGSEDQILELIQRNDQESHPFPRIGTTDSKEYLDWLLERTVTREIIARNESLKAFLVGMHERWHRLFVENLVDHTGFKEEVYPALSYHPSWQSLMAEYGKVSDRADKIIAKRDWRQLLEVVTIPDPNKIIFDRNNLEVTQSVAKFAKDIFKTAAMQRKKDTWFMAQFD